MGQIAKLLSEQTHGNLSSNIKANPQEHHKSITLRSGKQVEMWKDMLLIKDKEPTVEDREELIKERGPNPSKERTESSLVKKYIPHLSYLSMLK